MAQGDAGAIPASAGERMQPLRLPISQWGYPRERGGTICAATGASAVMGLSPRARGNAGLEQRDER